MGTSEKIRVNFVFSENLSNDLFLCSSFRDIYYVRIWFSVSSKDSPWLRVVFT